MDRRTLLKMIALPVVAAAQDGPGKAKITSAVLLRTLTGTFERQLETAARSGVQAVELGAEYLAWSAAETAAKRTLIRSYGLAIASMPAGADSRPDRVSEIRRAIESARALDPMNLLVTVDAAPHNAQSLAEVVGAAGPALALEPANATSRDAALELVEASNSGDLRLVFDLTEQAAAPAASVMKAVPHVAIFRIAGRAGAKYPILQDIAKAGYGGVVSIRVEAPPAQQAATLTAALDGMREAFRPA